MSSLWQLLGGKATSAPPRSKHTWGGCPVCGNTEFTYLECASDLGTIDELAAQPDCQTCAFILQLASVETIRTIGPEGTMPDTPMNRATFSGRGFQLPNNLPMFRPQVISVYTEERRYRACRFAVAVNHAVRARVRINRSELGWRPPQPDEEGSASKPRILGRKPLDYNQIKEWLSQCEASHGANCNNADRLGSPVDIDLIDVVDMCLVSSTSASKYIAISYVMGGVSGLQSKVANRPSLSVPGTLDKLQSEVTTIIQDAITVTRELGHRYLWADTLCIVQDDPVDKGRQIAQMDVVYSHALLTLVSVSGTHSNCGLPGVRQNSRPEIPVTLEYQGFGSSRSSVVQFEGCPPRLDEILKPSTYESRGWTFQERALSRRMLYFTNWQVYFQCRSDLTCEHGAADDKDMKFVTMAKLTPLAGTLGLNTSVWTSRSDGAVEVDAAADDASGDSPQPAETAATPYERPEVFEDYAFLTENYTARQLTYASDVLNAFRGATNAIARQMPQEFICGLPSKFLDLALLWMPAERNRRRETPPEPKGPLLPTWSWAGWTGPITHACMIQNGQLRDWFSSEVRWLRRGLHNVSSFNGYALKFRAYTAPVSSFRYTGDSRRRDIELGEQDKPALYITDSRGSHCGVLLDFRDTIQDALSRNEDIEIVLLSKTSLNHINDEFDHTDFHIRIPERFESIWLKAFKYKDFSQGPGARCLANVMWVRWKGERAERLAIGQVHVDAWRAVQRGRKVIELV